MAKVHYEEFFEMKRTPFVRNLPVSELYRARVYEEMIGRLTYAAQEQKLAVVLADPGCGKSTLIRRLKEELSKKNYLFLYIADSKLTPKWLYATLLDQLGVESKFYRGDAKDLFQKELKRFHDVYKQKPVIVLDEAHLLEKETLEEFRFLLNNDCDSFSLASLILVGQYELWETKLSRKNYTAIRQRIDVACRLTHLDRAETGEYIHRHLEYAGCEHEIFTDSAIEEIYARTGGIPRMINKACEASLMFAAQQQKRLIDDHMARYVIDNELLLGDEVANEP